MQLYSTIVDEFLGNYDAFRDFAIAREFKNVTNPVDGLVYPGISTDIPPAIVHEILGNLETVVGGRIIPRTMFMRLSLKGTPQPHQAHTDALMGEYSLMLYLNPKHQCRGGTSVLAHVNGMQLHPTTKDEQDLWQRDTNSPGKWRVLSYCPMVPNRAFIFDSRLFHRAEPMGGFGITPIDGRLVLTCFFDRPR